jgi:hypothetical protein
MWCGQRPQLGGADIDKTKKAQKQIWPMAPEVPKKIKQQQPTMLRTFK